MEIGESLKKHRESRFLSQQEVADYLQISRQTISKWETSVSLPNIVFLLKLSQYYQISLDDLVKWEDSLLINQSEIKRRTTYMKIVDYFNKPKIIQEVAYWLVLAVLCLSLRNFIFNPVRVYGASMEPTYHTSDRVWQNKLQEPKRFDVVTYPSPQNGKKVIKRIIGLPGDEIEFLNDQLLINGQEIAEPFLEEYRSSVIDGHPFTTNFKTVDLQATKGIGIVPENHYFLLGDNRRNSEDSRRYGYVNQEEISGVVYFRYYPFDQMGWQ